MFRGVLKEDDFLVAKKLRKIKNLIDFSLTIDYFSYIKFPQTNRFSIFIPKIEYYNHEGHEVHEESLVHIIPIKNRLYYTWSFE